MKILYLLLIVFVNLLLAVSCHISHTNYSISKLPQIICTSLGKPFLAYNQAVIIPNKQIYIIRILISFYNFIPTECVTVVFFICNNNILCIYLICEFNSYHLSIYIMEFLLIALIHSNHSYIQKYYRH